MIDLRNKALPDSIKVRGRAYKVYTDFRVWINFAHVLQSSNCTLRDLAFVFVDSIPNCDFTDDVMRFYYNPNSTPNSMNTGSNTDTLFDLVEDGEYIYASFMKDYNIDLLETDMHWWKFRALFFSLSDETKMGKIMGYRGYKKPSKGDTVEASHARLKRMWSLDECLTEEERQALEEFNSL